MVIIIREGALEDQGVEYIPLTLMLMEERELLAFLVKAARCLINWVSSQTEDGALDLMEVMGAEISKSITVRFEEYSEGRAH